MSEEITHDKNPLGGQQLEFWEKNVIPEEMKPAYRALTPKRLVMMESFTMNAAWDANVNPHERIRETLKNSAKSGELVVTVDGEPALYDIREAVLQAIQKGQVLIEGEGESDGSN